MRMLLKPATGSGRWPWSTRVPSTVPGTVAGNQDRTSTPARESSVPSVVPAKSSIVNDQPDSSGTVPSAATVRSGAFSVLPPSQLVQPSAFGRPVRATP
ncbi:hypothetical protein JNW91_08275 [Micromonospora sp. STR1_7]|uniref:Uncharacterized protein n=1 Tax=Micromonospora parastrephiae TaxID=2806101 RepID=A0ABS1XRH4_9ACTN|nr:hypothetical protein [Micromonospora parastrephiae]MBM0231851.1 hypothetical protein [Micromonospora parastrephiae]